MPPAPLLPLGGARAITLAVAYWMPEHKGVVILEQISAQDLVVNSCCRLLLITLAVTLRFAACVEVPQALFTPTKRCCDLDSKCRFLS